MGILKTTPDIGRAGTAFTLSGTNLPANKDVTIIWNTANVDVGRRRHGPTASTTSDARRRSSESSSRTAKTDANGAFCVELKAPQDFGGIHDIYAVIDGVQVAKGGFLIARSATMTPKHGPIGTMVTLTYTRPRLVALRGRRVAAVRQPATSAP